MLCEVPLGRGKPGFAPKAASLFAHVRKLREGPSHAGRPRVPSVAWRSDPSAQRPKTAADGSRCPGVLYQPGSHAAGEKRELAGVRPGRARAAGGRAGARLDPHVRRLPLPLSGAAAFVQHSVA